MEIPMERMPKIHEKTASQKICVQTASWPLHGYLRAHEIPVEGTRAFLSIDFLRGTDISILQSSSLTIYYRRFCMTEFDYKLHFIAATHSALGTPT